MTGKDGQRRPATALDAAYEAFRAAWMELEDRSMTRPDLSAWPMTLGECDLEFIEAFRRGLAAAFAFVGVKQEDIRQVESGGQLELKYANAAAILAHRDQLTADQFGQRQGKDGNE
jgi:hypothetical protein